MDSILKKPGIKYLARVNSLANLFNNAININDSNGAYNLLFRMRTIHGKVLCKYHKFTKGKRCTKQLFYMSCLHSVITLMNEKIVETEHVFNNYVSDNNVDPSVLRIIRPKSSKRSSAGLSSNSSADLSATSATSTTSATSADASFELGPRTTNANSKPKDGYLSDRETTSETYSDLVSTLSDRYSKEIMSAKAKLINSN